MKTVSNTKEFTFFDIWYYRMTRIINGMCYEYGLCVTETEMRYGRNVVAWKMRDARRKFRRYIEDMELERCGLTGEQFVGLRARP